MAHVASEGGAAESGGGGSDPSPAHPAGDRPPAVGPPLEGRRQTTEEPAEGQRDARTVDLDPQTTNITNLFCVWSVGFVTAIEGTVVVPSLWHYIESLGGTEDYYGLCLSAFAFGRLACMGLYGTWVDRRPYREVFVVSLVISTLSGMLYSAAPTFGLWTILVGRAVLGATSAQSVATQTFVSRNTSLRDRTKYMSINVLLSNTLVLAGPAFNLLIVCLPHFQIGIGSRRWYFDNFTWVGYFICSIQLLMLALILFCFREPPRKRFRQAPPLGTCGKVITLGGFFPWMRVWVDPWLFKTGSWHIFFYNFRNNFINFSVTYTIPLLTDRDYGWGQLENSYVLGTASVASIISTIVIGYSSRCMEDRGIYLLWATLQHSGLLFYTVLSAFGTHKISVPVFVACWAWVESGTTAPAVQSLYSKLIGKGNAGLYFSVLQSNGAVSRMLSGQLVALTWVHLGKSKLWIVCHAFWLVSWAVTLCMWKRVTPDYITEMHARLDAERQEALLHQQPPGANAERQEALLHQQTPGATIQPTP